MIPTRMRRPFPIGISDAFMVDVLAEQIAGMAGKLARVPAEEEEQQGQGSSLPYLDEDERESVQKSKTVLCRNRHNKMTNSLRQLCKPRELKQGTLRDCRYDVLIENYDGTGRDLLIELKPDPDKGANLFYQKAGAGGHVPFFQCRNARSSANLDSSDRSAILLRLWSVVSKIQKMDLQSDSTSDLRSGLLVRLPQLTSQ